jgi:glycerate-2-kinase
MEGEAADMGREIAERIQSLSDEKQPGPYCLIFGGETTVTHSGKGKGGRSQELALAALIELQEYNKNFALLSAGTDGTDGPTDAAGAIISNETVKRMNELKQEPEAYLNRHDSYLFFEKLAALIKTGPTGTNVMDLVIVLVEG